MLHGDRDTEEATAQIGAHMLAEVMGYNVVKSAHNTAEYLLGFPYADLVQAKIDAQRAVSWILNEVGGEI